MARDQQAQSHGNSAIISSAPESTSSSVAAVISPPATVSVPASAPLAHVASPSPATHTAPLPQPSATSSSTSSTLAATDDVKPLAAPAVTSPESSFPAPPPSTVSTAAAATTATATALPSQPAAPQQNGDSRAAEPEPNPPSSTEMSNQHPGAPHGQPVSYPGHANPYPPAIGVSAAHYASYPAVVTQPTDPYRQGPVPVGSNVMSLPSMRTIDPMSQQQGPPVAGPQAMSMGMPMAPVQTGVPFYGHHNIPMAPGYALPSDQMARYAIPHDPRLLGHRGPKKEIKRRTKTGCLTCRKRRIKCDETHPTCNNCKKSKRECLGYDPIFRQQSGNQNATHIQPTPSSQLTPPSIPSSLPPTVPSSVPSNPALTARATNSYGNQPSMLPSSYAPAHVSTTSSSLPATSLPYGHSSVVKPEPGYPIKSESGYEYSSAIDPALQTLPSANQDSSRLLDHKPLVDSSLHLRAKMKIDEIIDQLGPSPPAQEINPTEEVMSQITKVYHEIYVLGLSTFFETNWYYFVEDGKMSFPKDTKLIGLMSNFLQVLDAVSTNDPAQMASSGILETRIVWELARLSYQTPDPSFELEIQSLPGNNDPKEAKNRVHVLEALLCGEYLSTNPLTPPLGDPDVHRVRQFEFWYLLGDFVRSQVEPNSTASIAAREDTLNRMRTLLDGRENRDVLYSIAVVRQLAPDYEAGYGTTIPHYPDESDPKNKLAVATKFILAEAQVTGGTTNVVRRFSDIASRAFVNPGVNIGRQS